jgi:steroid 5-alpha reductase family enzyme
MRVEGFTGASRCLSVSAPVVAVRPWSGFALVSVAYLAAHLVAGATVRALPEWRPLAAVAVADGLATVTVFIFSRALNNTSVYDPYWSVAPWSIAWWLALGPGAGEGLTLRQGVVLALVTLYAVRLTLNWARGWTGLEHEDWRYVDLRRKTGRAYWLVSFTALHFFPTVMVFLGILPLEAALVDGRHGFGALDLVASVVTLGAISIEHVADEQLRAFRRTAAPGSICDVGLWAYSRHPNYFGEILFWVGLWLFGVAAGAPWWTAAGVVAMVGLFVGASIPLAERRSLERRPQYAEHQRRVSMLVPWFPRRG